MTLTFNADRYQALLAQYQPRLIRTESENERALTIVEELMHCSDRTPEEEELYQLLIVLIEKFEQEEYAPGSAASPSSLLLFLMDQRQLGTADLVSVLGTVEQVTGIIDGDRTINPMQARLLGSFFQVDPELFVG
jgi:HTH-type transcriptional regulator / antitoxin HigA